MAKLEGDAKAGIPGELDTDILGDQTVQHQSGHGGFANSYLGSAQIGVVTIGGTRSGFRTPQSDR
jgi:hypothetical protein